MRRAGLHKSKPSEMAELLESLKNGFKLHLQDEMIENLSECKANLPTNEEEKEFISEYIRKAKESGWLIGPFKSLASASRYLGKKVRRNPIGSVYTSGKLRMITHFSAPRSGVSVNSILAEEWCTVNYIQFKDQCRLISSQGKGAFLWIVDAQEAYLQLKLRKEEMHLLGCVWEQRAFIITVLMLGLRCAPRIYTLFADMVLEMLVGIYPHLASSESMRLIAHYLDDFFGCHKDKTIAFEQFNKLKGLFKLLNIPFKEGKAHEPSTRQKLLGLIHDTMEQGVLFPRDKAEAYAEQCKTAIANGAITKKEAQSLAGKLRFASKVYFGGEGFVRPLEEAMKAVKYAQWTVTLSDAIKDDLMYWIELLSLKDFCCPYSFILSDPKAGDIKLCTDASGAIGLGAVISNGWYFQMKWQSIWPACKSVDIYFGESLALAVALKLLQAEAADKSVTCFIDNENAEHAFRKKRCKFTRKDIALLIRTTCVQCTKRRTRYWTERIKSAENILADDLSRFKEVRINQQSECFGIYALSYKLEESKVKEAVIELLGALYNSVHPPLYGAAAEKDSMKG